MTAYQRITAPQSAAFFTPEEKPTGCIEVAGYGHIPRRENLSHAAADVYLITGKKMRWVRDER